MLAKLNVDYVIVGHSERRQLFGETDEIGEPEGQGGAQARDAADRVRGRDARRARGGRDRRSGHGQTRAAFAGVKAADAEECVVAYEPIWAIGTGRNATPDDAERRRSASIRAALRDLYDDATAAGGAHPVRREREARQHRRADGDARDRRCARRRGVARPRRLRQDRAVPALTTSRRRAGAARGSVLGRPGAGTRRGTVGTSRAR